VCTDVKEEGQKDFLGGTDLREKNEGPTLKSIDDFNKAKTDGGEEAPVLDRLQTVMQELGIERELFDQVVNGMKAEYQSQNMNESEVLTAIFTELGAKMKAMMKSIAADRQRMK
jgi:phytoene/squalene synthetase